VVALHRNGLARIVDADSCVPHGDCSTQTVNIDIFAASAPPMRVVGLYKQPLQTAAVFRDAVLPVITRAISTTRANIVIGDFNGRHHWWEPGARDDAVGKVVIDWSSRCNLTCLSKEQAASVATHDNGSVLDLVFADAAARASRPKVWIDQVSAPTSDHRAVWAQFQGSAERDLPLPWRVPWNMSWDQFAVAADQVAASMQQELAPILLSSEHPQIVVNKLEEAVRTGLLHLAAMFLFKPKLSAHKPVRHSPAKRALLLKYRAVARVVYSRNRSGGLISATVRQTYLQLRSELRSLADSERATAKARSLASLNSPGISAKERWRRLKRLIPAANKCVGPVSIRHPASGILADNLRASLENLSAVFCSQSKADRQAGDLSDTTAQVENYVRALPAPNPADHVPFTVDELDAALDELDNDTATGADDVPACIIKRISVPLKCQVLALINYSKAQCVLPPIWKLGLVTPLHKGGDATVGSNFRPVAVPPVLPRTMERMVLRRIAPTLLPHLPPQQSGFQRGRSMSESLLVLMHAATEALRASSFRPVAFLDLAKAYDSVWHDGLLFKLARLGLSVNDILWIKALICDRSYRIRWNGVLSAAYSTTAGLGQGMVLACLLFIIFIYDLNEAVKGVAALQSADDLCIIPESLGAQGIPELQAAISELSAYLARWRLTLSPAKSSIVVFKNNGLRVPAFTVSAGSVLIPQTNQVKYLGVVVDSSVSFTFHRNQQLAKAKRLAGMMKWALLSGTSGWVVPIGPCITIVRAILQPTLLYASEFWLVGAAQMQKSLNRCLANVLNVSLRLPSRAPARGMLAECGIVDCATDCEARLLSLVSRVLTVAGPTPAKYLLGLEIAHATGHEVPERIMTIGERAAELRLKWQLPLAVSRRVLRDRKRLLTFSTWQNDPKPAVLSQVLTEFGPAMYLSRDNESIPIRAACRFGTLLTQQRRALISSDGGVDPSCPSCPGVIQTVDHLMLDCPDLQVQRLSAVAALTTAGIAFSSSILRGQVNLVPPQLRSTSLRLSMPFLRVIYEKTFVP